jgi:hypothetical protein
VPSHADWSFSALFNALSTFPSELAVLKRERAGGFYRLSPYFLAKTVVDLPLSMLYPLLFVNIVYWAVGLNLTPGAYFLHLFVIIVTVLVAEVRQRDPPRSCIAVPRGSSSVVSWRVACSRWVS